MRLIIEICGGCLHAVYGDPMPEGTVLDIILRDLDNIEQGGDDPCPEVWDDAVDYL